MALVETMVLEAPTASEGSQASQLSSDGRGGGKGTGKIASPPLPGQVHTATSAFLQQELEESAGKDGVPVAAGPGSSVQEAPSISTVDGKSCVSLGFDVGFFSGLDDRGEKQVRSLLFGHHGEILELLRSQAPSLELEVDFQAGQLVSEGADSDLASALPQVCALVANLQPELISKLVQIRGRMAAEARAEDLLMQQRAEEIRRRPREASAAPTPFDAETLAVLALEEEERRAENERKALCQFELRVAKLLPAPIPQSLLEFQPSDFQKSKRWVQVLPGRCWVVPGVLTGGECDDWISRAQEHGMQHSVRNAYRHNSRTKNFIDLDMARLVWSRFPADLLGEVGATAPKTVVRSVHEQWRISKYLPGQYFRAHYDESYTRGTEYGNEGGIISNECAEHGEKSSHTLLLILSDGFSKGATRFWPTGRYDEAIDVAAPAGSMLVFEQLSLLHEGCGLEAGSKFVAQGALMRAPAHALSRSTPTHSTGFKMGPGQGGRIGNA